MAAAAVAALAACSDSSSQPSATSTSQTGQSQQRTIDPKINAAAQSPQAQQLAASFLKSRPGQGVSGIPRIDSAGDAVTVYGVDPKFVASGGTSERIGTTLYVAVPVRLNGAPAVDTMQLTPTPNGSYTPDAVASGNEEQATQSRVTGRGRLLLFSPTRTWFAWNAEGVIGLSSEQDKNVVGRHLNATQFRDWIRGPR